MNQLLFLTYAFFLIYFLTLNFIYFVLLILAFIGSIRRLYEAKYTDFELTARSGLTIPVSVVIPAYNEELGIVNAVYSALNSIHPEFEVIVVNDGSTDRTLAVLKQEFDLEARDIFYRQQLPTRRVRRVYRSRRYPKLWVIDKENGGKADALNAGVNLAHYRYVVTTDADSIFHPQGLLRIVRMVNLDPARIVGIGGQIRVGNGLKVEKGHVRSTRLPRRLVVNFQVIEYLSSFLGNRVGWSEINSVLVISGAFGMWRRDVFIELGGMTSDTTHEDIEFTFRVHEAFRRRRLPYRIVFIPDPIVWTEVPNNWRGLFRQRRRWQRVVNEVFWKFRRMLLDPSYGSVGLLGMPYLLIYEIFGPFIELFSYAALIAAVSLGAFELKLFLLFLIVSLGLTSSLRIASVFIEQYSFRTYPLRALPRLFLLALFENVCYHQFVSIARIPAFFDFLRGRKAWERVERRGLAAEA